MPSQLFSKLTSVLNDIYKNYTDKDDIPVRKIIIDVIDKTVRKLYKKLKNEILDFLKKNNIDVEINITHYEKLLREKLIDILEDKLDDFKILNLKIDDKAAKMFENVLKDLMDDTLDEININTLIEKIKLLIKEKPKLSNKKILKVINNFFEDNYHRMVLDFKDKITSGIISNIVEIAADKISEELKEKIDEKLDGPSEFLANTAVDILNDNAGSISNAIINSLTKDGDAKEIKEVPETKSKEFKLSELLDSSAPTQSITPQNTQADLDDKKADKIDVEEVVEEVVEKIGEVRDDFMEKLEETIDNIKEKIENIRDQIDETLENMTNKETNTTTDTD